MYRHRYPGTALSRAIRPGFEGRHYERVMTAVVKTVMTPPAEPHFRN
jgi:hypothetical protein